MELLNVLCFQKNLKIVFLRLVISFILFKNLKIVRFKDFLGLNFSILKFFNLKIYFAPDYFVSRNDKLQ
jgi:hypothetical protein